MPRTLSPTLLVALMLGACSVTASLGGDDEGSTGTQMVGTSGGLASSSGVVAGTGTVGAGTQIGTTGGVGAASTDSGTATSATLSSGGSEDDSTGPQPLVCQGPSDASCLSCLRDSCCDALEVCLGTPLCACLLGCLEFAPDFVSCLDIPACDEGPAAGELQTCAAGGCGPVCGF